MPRTFMQVTEKQKDKANIKQDSSQKRMVFHKRYDQI